MLKKGIRKLYQIWFLASGISCGVVIFSIGNVLGSMAQKQSTRDKILRPCWRLWCQFVVRISLLTRLYVIDRRRNQKYSPASGLIISNHLSILDIPLIHTRIAAYCLMKTEILKYPFIGRAAKISGAIPVDRKSAESRKATFQKCLDHLNRDDCLMYYPEGTRSKTGKPRPVEKIKRPLLATAYQLKKPIIPISVYGSDQIFKIQKKWKPTHPLGLIFHREIDPKNYPTQEEFINHAWNTVCTGFSELAQYFEASDF